MKPVKRKRVENLEIKRLFQKRKRPILYGREG
jgi:hypothetical protein